jgi:hypothetical protein
MGYSSEWSAAAEREAPDRSRTAGRTSVSGLLGGTAALANALGAISVLVGGFIAFAGIRWYKARERP